MSEARPRYRSFVIMLSGALSTTTILSGTATSTVLVITAVAQAHQRRHAHRRRWGAAC